MIYVLAFVAMVLLVQGVSAILFASRDRNERTNRRLTLMASGMSQSEVYATLVRRPVNSEGKEFPLLHLYGRFANYCRQAGVESSPSRLLATVLISSVTLWLVSFLLLRAGTFGSLLVNGIFGLPAACVICGLGFWLWISRKHAKRLKLLEEQMPLALDVVIRGLRAGHPAISAVRLAAEEMGDPIGSEFGVIVDETTYGYEFREALMNFARRTGSPDASFFAVSVGIQSETGGNLAEILEGLANVMRSRATLAKRVRSLSSEGRASAALLSVLPIFMIAMMTLTNAQYYASKFSDPIFWPTAGTVGLGYLVGLYMIRRIINFRY